MTKDEIREFLYKPIPNIQERLGTLEELVAELLIQMRQVTDIIHSTPDAKK